MFKNNRTSEIELECLPHNEIKECTYLVDTIKVISSILHHVFSFLYDINIQLPPQITTLQIYNNWRREKTEVVLLEWKDCLLTWILRGEM